MSTCGGACRFVVLSGAGESSDTEELPVGMADDDEPAVGMVVTFVWFASMGKCVACG